MENAAKEAAKERAFERELTIELVKKDRSNSTDNKTKNKASIINYQDSLVTLCHVLFYSVLIDYLIKPAFLDREYIVKH